MKIGFIGAGKAGCSLSRYLKDSQDMISGFYSKTYEHARQAADDVQSVAFSDLKQVVFNSDMIFITTPDSAISQIWDTIKQWEEQGFLQIEGKIFCHCSGSLSSQVFWEIRKKKAFGCSLHPMLAISSRDTDLSQAFFTADGDERAVSAVKAPLEKRGNPVAVIEPACKKKYHMAASTVSNLAVGLVQMALDSLQECGFEPDFALKMLTPLMEGNMKNICEKGTVRALTGPAERADAATVAAHLSQLTGEKQEIYRLLSKQLLDLAERKNETRDYTSLRKLLEEKD